MIAPPESNKRPARLAPLHDALACVERIAQPVAPRTIELGMACGHVLAADLSVGRLMPPVALSLRDGWAVRADDIADAGPYAPQLLASPAWVEVGDPLPANCDAVLPADAVTISGQMAEAHASLAAGDGVLAAGSDAQPKGLLRRAGQCLRLSDVAILQTLGLSHVLVRQPRVKVCGVNPLIEAGIDTVGPLVAHFVEAGGGVPVLDPGASDPARLAEALIDETVDAVIAIGGTGVGRRDRSIRILETVGRIEIHGIGLIPGETAAIGVAGSKPVLMLPGRLDAALAVWLVLGRKLMAALSGRIERDPTVPVTLRRKIVSTVGMAEVIPLRRCEGGVEPVASGFFPLGRLVGADGWVLITPESEGQPAGSTIDMQAFA
ncbi:MAG TPA: molybdopterin-binding protein [Xanthobacteraceae bacterium]|jgi:molybdopterin biosynthesis enzyme|nr:molybdopterin-binding protein [Xanthobacteraceae bacterium]